MTITIGDIYGAIGLVALACTIYFLRKIKQRVKSQEEKRCSDENGLQE